MNYRQMPHDLEAERALLGLLLQKGQSVDDISAFLQPNQFYDRNNATIYWAIVSLARQNQAVNLISVKDYLNIHHYLNRIGGINYLTYLMNNIPVGVTLKSACKIVLRKALYRAYIRMFQRGTEASYNQKGLSKISQSIEASLLRLSHLNNSKGLQSVRSLLPQVMNHIDKLEKNHRRIAGLGTGFSSIDDITTGLYPGEFVVIAARPGMGKTTLAMNIAQNVATNTNQAVAIFSLEMSSSSLIDRMICAAGNINHQHLRTGFLTSREMQDMVKPVYDLAHNQLYIDDTPGINVTTIMARCRRLVKSGTPLKLIVVDYLQLVEGDSRDGRQQEVAGISRQLKKLAKALNVPIIALSQLSRSVEQREDKKPQLSDIRESGAIEQDADIIAFLYRKDYYDDHDKKTKHQSLAQQQQIKKKNAKQGDPSITDFIIDKNREGPRGELKLMMLKAFNKFGVISPQEMQNLSSKVHQ